MNRLFLVIAACLAALTVSARTTDADLLRIQKECKFGEFWGQRATLFNALGVDSTSIVMFGNSITNGCEWHELFSDPRVLNRGISSDTVDGLLRRLDAVVDGRPAKIFLLIGVNDVSHDLTADSIASSIMNLVSEIRRRTPSTRLYVQSLLPFNYVDFGRYSRLKDKEQVVRDINALLRPASEAVGAVFIDLYPSFVDDRGNLRADWTNDGLHLTGPGYVAWRSILAPYIAE